MYYPGLTQVLGGIVHGGDAGGIHERKNIPRLIQAFAKLCEEEGYAGKLIITGKASGAPYQEKMRTICDAAVAETGLGDRILFADTGAWAGLEVVNVEALETAQP